MYKDFHSTTVMNNKSIFTDNNYNEQYQSIIDNAITAGETSNTSNTEATIAPHKYSSLFSSDAHDAEILNVRHRTVQAIQSQNTHQSINQSIYLANCATT